MNGLRERFDTMADTAGPPSGLSADTVFSTAWRRRRRRTVVAAVAALAVTALVAVGGLNAVHRGPQYADTPDPEVTADGWPSDTRDGDVVSAIATDARHIYAVVNRCAEPAGKRRCTADLLGSDDGGGTWTLRRENVSGARLSSPARGVLLHQFVTGPEEPKSQADDRRVSTDGGRTWQTMARGTEPRREVPANGWLQCWSDDPRNVPCTVGAFDPVTGRWGPLATQPGIAVDDIGLAPSGAGFWVLGTETGGARRPVLAVSTDRGRTWSMHVFDVTGADPANGRQPKIASVDTHDGTVAYAVVRTRDDEPLIYRTTNGGKTWQQTAAQGIPGDRYFENGDGYVAADGRHLMITRKDRPQTWVGSTDGGASYRPWQPDGLGDDLLLTNLFTRVAANHPDVYLAHDRRHLYLSADGLRWSRVAPKV